MKKITCDEADMVIEDMIDRLLGITTDVKINDITGQYPADFLDDPQESKRKVFKESYESNGYICFKVIDFLKDNYSIGRAVNSKSGLVRLIIHGKKILLPALKLADIIRKSSEQGFVVRKNGSDAFYVKVRKQLLFDSAIPV